MMSEIEVQRDLFRRWFKQPLIDLYNNPDAGFPILMITLPLLERYLREKTNNHQENLQDDFHVALGQMLPTLCDVPISRKFWRLYRHGSCIGAGSSKLRHRLSWECLLKACRSPYSNAVHHPYIPSRMRNIASIQFVLTSRFTAGYERSKARRLLAAQQAIPPSRPSKRTSKRT